MTRFRRMSRICLVFIALLAGWSLNGQAVTTGGPLTSGQAVIFQFPAPTVSGPTLYVGIYTFTIVVPPGAGALTFSARGVPPVGGVTPSSFSLMIRHNQEVAVQGGTQLVFDHSTPNGTTHSLTISSASTPALRAGTYYISLLVTTINFSGETMLPIAGTITATFGAAGPSRVRLLSGNNQTGPPGALLPDPLEFAVENASGGPVSGTNVNFTVTNATVTPSSGTTDVNGRIQTRVTLGSTVGSATVTASVAGATSASATMTVAAPAVTITSIVNGASFQPEVPSQSWITIRGANLSNTTRVWTGSDFQGTTLPTTLDGVSVRINGKSAAVSYISPTQINVLAPYDTATGPVLVNVTSPLGTAQTTVTLRRMAPSFFMFDPENRKYVAAVHPDGTYGGKPGLFGTAVSTRSFVPGGRALLFGTGFGDTSPLVPTDRVFQGASSLAANVTIRIGGVAATVEFAGLVGVGLYQFNIVVPNLAAGDHAVVAEIGGVSSGTGSFLTLAAPPPAALPDLVITEIQAPAAGTLGRELNPVRMTVTNRGGPTTRGFEVGYYLSSDARITADDLYTGWLCQVPNALAQGASYTCSGPTDLPAGISPGAWYFGVIADHRGVIPEADESNNAQAASGATTIARPTAANIAVLPSALGFTAVQGGPAPASQPLGIGVIPAGAFQVRSNATWISLSSSEGTESTAIRVTVNHANLAVGYYAGQITFFRTENPTATIVVDVGLAVSAASSPSRLTVMPAELTFARRAGEAGVEVKRLTFSYAGPTSYSFWALAGTSQRAGWLRGTYGLVPGSFDVSVDTSQLGPGSYSGFVLAFGPQFSNPLIQIPVTLTVVE